MIELFNRMLRRSGAFAFLVAAAALAVPAGAKATVLFSESFDTDTASTAATLAQYSDFTLTGGNAGTSVLVSGGSLVIGPRSAGSAATQVFDVGGYAGNLKITADLTNNPGGERINVGVSIGANNIVFHPGLTAGTFPQGSYRVDGPGGSPNEDMGFVPATAAFNHIEITIIEATGVFDVRITDGVTPTNVFQSSFTNTGYSAGDRIGFSTGSFVGAGTALFDNLKIESLATTIPEPAPLALIGFGLVVFGFARSRRRI